MKEFVITPFWFETILAAIKVLIVIGAVLGLVPMMVLWERVLIGRIQQRPGPNRVGLDFLPGLGWLKGKFIIGGILQTIVDGLKLFLKENIVPASADKVLHAIAPLINLVPALVLLAVLPIGPTFLFQPSNFSFHLPGLGLHVILPHYEGLYAMKIGISDLPIGVLFYLAVSGLGVYGIVLGGWASNSKYALLGGIRSSAQMLSYELALGLSILGLLLITGTINLREIADQQSRGLWSWNIFTQPVGFILFFIAGFAETNRLPFDLPEGESELGAGFHTEFSSMKFALFMLSEYANIIVFSVLVSTLFLGGYNAPHPALMIFPEGSWLCGIMGIVWLSVKFFVIFTFMVITRGTLPRLRYDQLMDFGWKLMLPLALVNLVVTALALAVAQPAGQIVLSIKAILLLFVVGVIQLAAIDRYLTIRKKRLLASC